MTAGPSALIVADTAATPGLRSLRAGRVTRTWSRAISIVAPIALGQGSSAPPVEVCGLCVRRNGISAAADQ